MRKLLLFIIIGLAIALGLSYLIQLDPGYVRISVGHWLIESNLWVLLSLNVALIFGLLILGFLIRRTRFAGQYIREKLGKSAEIRAKEKTEKGIIALLEGSWSDARKLLLKSARKTSSPIINYLAAAHASNEMGELKEAETLLKKAYESTPDSAFAVGIAQTRILIQQNQFESALAVLLRLKKQQAHHPFVLKQLKAVYLKLEDWHQLIKLIPSLRKDLKEDETKLQELEQLAWKKLFQQKADELINRNSLDLATEELASLWKSVPDKLYADVTLVKTYAEQLIKLKQSAESETLLRITLNKHWDAELVNLYGIVSGADLNEQLIHAENWLKQKPNNAPLLLALGRISLQNKRWAEALEYFEASYSLHQTRETLAELCRLQLRMKKHQNNLNTMLETLLSQLELPSLPLPEPK